MLARNALFKLLFLLIGALSYGQHSVRGNVVDAETEEPLPHASIVFNASHLNVVADRNGMFAFESAVPLTSLVCVLKGYQPYVMQLRPRNVSLNIQMVRIVPRNRENHENSAPVSK